MHKNSMNKVILVGYLGQDPELKSTSNNMHVVNISIATNETFKRKGESEYTDKTEWHRCVAFGKTADYISTYITKGRLVYIDGKLQTRKWTDKDNNTRYSTDVMIETIILLGKNDSFQPKVSNENISNQDTVSNNNQSEDDDLPF